MPQNAVMLTGAASWYAAQDRLEDAERMHREACNLPMWSDVTLACSGYAAFLESQSRFGDVIDLYEEKLAKLEKVYVDETKVSRDWSRGHMSESVDTELVGALRPFKEKLVRTYIKAGRLADAMDLLEKERAKRPYEIGEAIMLAHLYDSLGLDREALLIVRAAEYAALTKTDDSRYPSILVLGPHNREEWIERIKTRRAVGIPLTELEYHTLAASSSADADAIALLEEGIEHIPDSYHLRILLALLFEKGEDPANAKRHCDKALELFFHHVQRAAIKDRLTSIEASLLGQDPMSSTVIPPQDFVSGCFNILLQQGREDEVPALQERMCEAIARASRDSRIALDGRATVLMGRADAEMGAWRYAEAAQAFEECFELPLGKQDMWLPQGLAICYERLSQPDQAIVWYRRSIELAGLDANRAEGLLVAIASQQGIDGLTEELPRLLEKRDQDVFLNAILSSFQARLAMHNDDRETALKAATEARAYEMMARALDSSLALLEPYSTTPVILEAVESWLGNDEQAKLYADRLAAIPRSQVEAKRRILGLSKSAETINDPVKPAPER